MKIGLRICTTIALVAIGGGGLYRQDGRQPAVVQRSVVERSAPLPQIRIDMNVAGAITKIELTQSEPELEAEAASRSGTITLEKQGSQWEVTSPVKTWASASKVAALLENLRELRVTDAIDPDASNYGLYELTEAKALRVVAWKGDAKVSDLYFGRTDRGGRSVRIGDRDGVFSVANSGPGGYSGFLYTRGLRSWRETSILHFGEDDAIEVEVTNGNGRFLFVRNGRTWSGSLIKRDRRGKLGEPEPEWTRFDGSNVDDLLRAYRSLSADDFGDEDKRAASGVDNAEQTGGVVRIRFRGGAGDRSIRVGRVSTNAGRWAIGNSRWAIDGEGDGTLYVLAPWTADWATANASKFESAEDRRGSSGVRPHASGGPLGL